MLPGSRRCRARVKANYREPSARHCGSAKHAGPPYRHWPERVRAPARSRVQKPLSGQGRPAGELVQPCKTQCWPPASSGQACAAALLLAAPGYWLQSLSERSLQSGAAPRRQPVTRSGASPAFLCCWGWHGGPLCRCRTGRGVSNTGRRADPGSTPSQALATALATREGKKAKAGARPLRGL